MLQKLKRFAFGIALGVASLSMAPMQAHAQYPATSTQQRAFQAGFDNGGNDANQHKALNLKTGKWNGANLQAY